MTLGTPGFNGDRLRESREAQGISQADLARLIETSRQAISSYEKGVITPSPSMARLLADVLGVLPSFFQRVETLGATLPATSATYFRSNSKALAGDRKKGEFRVGLIIELLVQALEVVDIPDHNLPKLSVRSNPELIDAEFIEKVAHGLRDGWGVGLGPIQNMAWLLENQGVIVARDQVATNHIDAFSCWRGNHPVMILSSNKESAVRSRWDAAHELGHLILHRDLDPLRVSDKESLRLIERQANLFAGCFLLPRESYQRSIIIPTLEEFLKVKPIWKVSVQAQVQRCVALGMIGETTQTRMWKQIRTRGWSKREPLDDNLIAEEPELLRRSIEMGLEDRSLDLDQMSAEIGMTVDKLSSLLNLQVKVSHQAADPSNLLVFPEMRQSRRVQ